MLRRAILIGNFNDRGAENEFMPVLHLICGLPGSGKTTLARQLEISLPALRLAPDEWMSRIVGDGFDDEKRAAVEAVQWDIAGRALSLGLTVILENGFWTRQDRDHFRSRAAALGAQIKIHFLDVPHAELSRRLAQRNLTLPPDTFRVNQSQLDSYWKMFEPPSPDELE
jgi:predicted kinase